MSTARPAFEWELFGPSEMLAALGRERNFVKLLDLSADQLHFSLDDDDERWRFLRLPSHHPVLIEQIQYFLAVTSAWAFGLWKPGTRSALTQFRWNTAQAAFGASKPALARVRHRSLDQGLAALDMDITDDANQPLFHARCIGHVFAGRDFLTWRAQTKALAKAQFPSTPFAPAHSREAGLSPELTSFVSAPNQRVGQLQFDALVSTATGFRPSHPFHEGSGDHVNAAHLFDCALQVSHLLRPLADDKPWICESGEAQFQRFVELDVPFTLTTSSKPYSHTASWDLNLSVAQLGKPTTDITLRLSHPQG